MKPDVQLKQSKKMENNRMKKEIIPETSRAKLCKENVVKLVNDGGLVKK